MLSSCLHYPEGDAEALAMFFANCCIYGSDDMKLFLCDEVVFLSFANCLKKPDCEKNLISRVLNAIQVLVLNSSANDEIEKCINIFEETGLRDMIEQIGGYVKSEISKQAQCILDIIDGNDEDDEDWL